MSVSDDLWERIGDIELEDFPQIVHILFAAYEKKLVADPNNVEAKEFFETLERAVGQTSSCNANRR